MYTYEDAYQACLEYFKGDELATSTLVNKYLLQDKENNYLEKSPDDVFNRLTKEFFRIEKKYPNPLTKDEIYELLKDYKYIIPGGSALFGIGNQHQITSIANCFVIDQPEDNYNSIVNKDKELVHLMKRRGGVGIDLSKLRPSGSPINNAARYSDGVTCFMSRYSNTTKEVAQNGRRGALMITLDSRHPDLENFITIKQDLTKVNGANISIKWHDDFLKCAEKNEEYTLRFPVDSSIEKAKFTKVVNAKEIWDKFITANWNSAEPGCLYWDKIITNSLSDCYENHKTISTNPCGEITLSPYSSCILMSINLTSFVNNQFQKNTEFNWDKFKEVVYKANKLIDDMIDLELEKINKIIETIKSSNSIQKDKDDELYVWDKMKEKYIEGRRTGLGILGYGDMLAMLNLKYGSVEAQEFTEKLFKTYHQELMRSQAMLAKDRGIFPIFNMDNEKGNFYYNNLPKDIIELIEKYGRRNISFSTIAPTGSISMLAQVTSGIEPVFMRTYKRRRKLNTTEINQGIKPDHVDGDGIKWIIYDVYHHKLREWMKLFPDEDIEKSPYWQIEAGEIKWENRVKLQSIAQKYITHSISSTVNLPKDTSIEDVNNIYLNAWKLGCKGITIYREGCRAGVLFTDTQPEAVSKDRSKLLPCDIHYSTIEGNPWIIFIGMLDNNPYEVIGGKKSNVEIPKKYKTGWITKNGIVDGRRTYDLILGSLDDENEQLIIKDICHIFSTDASSYTRHISLSLRYGVPINVICETLHKDGDSDMFSFGKGIARCLKKYIKDGTSSKENCPDCGDPLKYKDGCVSCMSCGWSRCG